MTEQEEFEFRLRYEREQATPKPAEKPSRGVMGTIQDAGAGLVRGAGSIGATILTPYDLLAGNTKSIGNPERRAAMDGGFREMGVDTDSMAYGGGKLGGEIAGTAGVGSVFGMGAKAVGAAPKLVNALTSAGFSTGAPAAATLGGRAADLALRSVAGGAVGGASAGMVDPEMAGAGGAVGAALPGALGAAGAVGNKLGRLVRGPEVPADVAQAVAAAQKAGYVIPPTQAKPSLGNRVIEGMAGKITTAQNASAKNQTVTNKLAAEALGLPADAKISPEVLADVRKTAGQAYDTLRGSGTVQADQTYDKALNAIVAKYQGAAAGFPGLAKPEVESVITTLRQPVFTSDAAVDAVRVMREKADAAYGSGDKGLGSAFKDAANALEGQLERHLSASGDQAKLDAFRAARQLIAKTYSVEKALNPTTGAVDARKLAAQLAKGKPLSAGLKDAAQFAGRFPKAAQTVEGMGSLPQTSPLDWVPASAASFATGNPLMMAGVLARPGARSLALSPMVQNRLTAGGPNALEQLLMNPGLQQLGYRAAPVAVADR